ncbi:O-antigen ligase family protein [Pseudomonas juntendi]|uniref:O-antigen ligase family protein n=1 Tax=Pseudomonas TaxID=286 RepID=UPI0034D4CAF9
MAYIEDGKCHLYKMDSNLSEWLLAGAFLAMVPLMEGWNFFYSHVLFLAFVFFIGFTTGVRRSRWLLGFLFLTILLLINFALALRGGTEGRFVQDSVKLALFFGSLFFVVNFFSNDFCSSMLRKIIILFPFVFIGYFLFVFDGNMFAYSGRLYSPLFGSPNVVGVFCALAIIYLVGYRKDFSILALCSLFCFYLTVLGLGFSRAAIIGLALSLFFIFRFRGALSFLFVGIIFFVGLVAIDSIYPFIPDWVWQKGDVANDLEETGGSYRTLIWGLALERFASDPITFLFGEGVGRTITVAQYGFYVDHPHNFYIFLLLSYGIIFFLVFIFVWGRVCWRSVNYFMSGQRFNFSLFLFYSLIFMMDTHVLSSQFFIMHVLFLSLLFRSNYTK